jgi:hypothetical protein
MHTSPSAAHETMLRSSEKCMNWAWSTLLLWPVLKVKLGTASSQFHSATVRSSDPERSKLPSALKLKVLTQPLCFRSLLCMLRECTKSCASTVKLITSCHNNLLNQQARSLTNTKTQSDRLVTQYCNLIFVRFLLFLW